MRAEMGSCVMSSSRGSVAMKPNHAMFWIVVSVLASGCVITTESEEEYEDDTIGNAGEVSVEELSLIHI